MIKRGASVIPGAYMKAKQTFAFIGNKWLVLFTGYVIIEILLISFDLICDFFFYIFQTVRLSFTLFDTMKCCRAMRHFSSITIKWNFSSFLTDFLITF